MPYEVDNLLECLDEDGSGDIDVGELEAFWAASNQRYEQPDPGYFS